MRDKLEHVQTQWQNYERKLNDKREMLTTYADKLKELEKQHMGCIEKDSKARAEIEALQRVVNVEIQKHLEKDTLARKLEWEKQQMSMIMTELEIKLDRMQEEKTKREQMKKARLERRKSRLMENAAAEQ